MKGKRLLIAAIFFFILVNTHYYWESKLGFFGIPAFMILCVVYLILVICLLVQIFHACKERFKDRRRYWTLGLLTLILTITSFNPARIVNFNKLERNNLLVAQAEGAANCRTTLKLKENNMFVERKVCFGVSETKGNYSQNGDTIVFSNVKLGRHVEKKYFNFAVIKKTEFESEKILGALVRYENYSDTIGKTLWIIKNELNM